MTTALYVQDTWTRGRLTLQGALRYDRAWSLGPGRRQRDDRDVAVQRGADSRSSGRRAWTRINDISPRGGVAYDVFGNGKTAVKFNFGRYLAPATNDTPYTQNNPASRIVDTTPSRNWQDGNGNYVVDCDILNPAAQTVARWRHLRRAHRQRAELRQGRRQPDAGEPGHPAAGGASGRYDWQWGVDFQQELVPRVSLDVDYNRRWFGEFHGHRQPGRRARRLRDVDDHRADGLQASRRRRLPDHDATRRRPRQRRARRAELRDVRNGLRAGAHQLLARRRPHGRTRGSAAA